MNNTFGGSGGGSAFSESGHLEDLCMKDKGEIWGQLKAGSLTAHICHESKEKTMIQVIMRLNQSHFSNFRVAPQWSTAIMLIMNSNFVAHFSNINAVMKM